MITRIAVRNFKSLADFTLTDIGMFTCLIGLNGSGKTTLLQFIDFVKAILNGRVTEWLEEKNWTIQEIVTAGSQRKLIEIEIDFKVTVDDADDVILRWSANFNSAEKRCTYEILSCMNRTLNHYKTEILLSYKDGKLKLGDSVLDISPNLKYEGSILSFYTPDNILAVDKIKRMKIFDVLDPQSISQPTQTKSSKKKIEVDHDGKNLVGFISAMNKDEQDSLFSDMKKFYPSLANYRIRRQRFGWKNLLLNELEKIYFDASHLSYGTLRLFVLLSQKYSNSQFLLFDEIENGINQELVEKLIDSLQDFKGKQVMITTHSALVLNYLSDDAARNSVILLYKDKDGHTSAKKFFEIPEIANKLKLMGPGEAMGDTDLLSLASRLTQKNIISGE